MMRQKLTTVSGEMGTHGFLAAEHVPDIWCTETKLDQEMVLDACLDEYVCCNAATISTGGSDAAESQDEAHATYEHYVPASPDATGITAAQRANVVDGMIAAAASLCLTNDALFLGVACLDKYLKAATSSPQLLQPLSIACLWVAAKYDCVIIPPAAAFARFMIDPQGMSLGGATTSVDLLIMLEASVLETLDYRLASLTTTKEHKHAILEKAWAVPKAAALSSQQQQQLYSMVSYLTEVSLLEYQLLPCNADQVAAAAYVLAHVLLGMQLDCKLLSEVTGYSFSDVHVVVQYLCALHTTLSQAMENGKPYAVSVKYSSPVVHGVARVAPLVHPQDPRLSL